MIINFNDYNKALGTRKLGEAIRKDIEKHIQENQELIFDFSGIDVISSSFADECFGKLVNKYGLELIKNKTHFKNVNKFIKIVILDILKNYNQ